MNNAKYQPNPVETHRPRPRHIVRRCRVKRKFARRLKVHVSALAWCGGVLYHGDKPVAGAPHIPKPGRKALGRGDGR